MAGALDFDSWISERFRDLNTDETVFAPYIKSIVEGDEAMDEKIDALDGILAELTDDGSLDVEEFRKEILLRWEKEKSSTGKSGEALNVESKLQSILKLSDEASEATSQNETTGKGLKNFTQAPDKALRAAILNQYKDDDSDEESEVKAKISSTVQRSGEGGGGANLERNTNAERVLNEMKDKREREKADAAKKRERDKEDRAKQKQQAQDRKEKAKKKATKVERKR